ncbi:MAG TPA: alpha/beta hydrolase [Acidimicrobiales bacterium]
MAASSVWRSSPGLSGVSDTGGSGRPLVLLHGMGASRGIWEPFVDPLAGAHRVIAVDLPGFGDNAHLEPGLIGQVRCVRRVIDEMRLEAPVLVGHSMGTLPALMTTARSTAVCGSVAVEPSLDVGGFLASLTSEPIPDDEREFADFAVRSWQHMGIDCVPEPMRGFVISHMSPSRDVAMASWQAALSTDASNQQELMNTALRAVARPTLIVYGSEPSGAELAAASLIPDACVEIWEGLGHWVLYADPERFIARLEQFLATV